MRSKIKEFFEVMLSFPFMLLIIIVAGIGFYRVAMTDTAGLLSLFGVIVLLAIMAVIS